ERLDPSKQWEIVNFKYDTNSPTLSTEVFAKQLGESIDKYFKVSGPINHDEDKISFVVHSQGGMVAFLWTMYALSGDPEVHAEYFDCLDSFITLGSPFWGSNLATIADDYHKSNPNQELPGGWQLHELDFGSDTIVKLRHFLMNKEDTTERDTLLAQVRF